MSALFARPRRVVSKLAFALSLGLLACGSADDRNPTLRVDRVRIDSGQELSSEPGRGVGAHFEVDGRGRFTAFFTCDTKQSGYVCAFDLIASVEPPLELRDVRGDDLELDDYWYRIDAGAVRLFAFTAYDVDELRFSAPRGAAVRIDLLLDGASAAEAAAWVGGGRVRQGAPSMPFEFVPTE